MADSDQSFLWYLWDSFKDTFNPVRVYQKTQNVLSWKPIDYKPEEDEKSKYTWPISTVNSEPKPQTLNSVANSLWTPTVNNAWDKNVQSPDISIPKDLLWLNEQIDTNTNDVTLNEVANSDINDFTKVEQNLSVNSLDKIAQTEKELAQWETEWGFFEQARKWATNVFESVKEAQTNKATENLLEAMRQEKEVKTAIWYDPSSKNVTFMVYNRWQWYSDDFWSTVFSEWETKELEFKNLYQKFNQDALEVLNDTSLTYYQQAQAIDKLKSDFVKQVNERQIFKAREDDYYSNGSLFAAFGRWLDNLIYWWDDWVETFWRRYEQFSQDELDTLAKNKIEEWPLNVTWDMLQAFLDAEEKNWNIKEWYVLDPSENKADIQYSLSQDTLTSLKGVEQNKIYNPIMEEITKLIDNWDVSSEEWSAILEAAIADVIEPALSQMHLYMDPSLAYYTAVKNKDYWDLTSWEKAILWYWPWMLQFMEDYTNAVRDWALESIKTWIKDWKLVWAVESMDWMSIQDYFKNATMASNIQAWWLDLETRESIVDWMQHMNQNIASLYWQDKWWTFRQVKNRLNQTAWWYWYTAWELWQDVWWLVLRWLWWLWWDSAEKAADYTQADFTRWMMLATDYSILWSKNFWRLAAEWWLQSMENLPEFAWAIYWTKPILRWNIWKASRAQQFANIWKMSNGAKQLKAYSDFLKSAKATTAPAAQQWVKWYLTSVWEKVVPWLDNAVWKAIWSRWTNLIRRTVSDQVLDSALSYYDTENYSVPSTLISIAWTWLFEVFPALFKDTEFLKMLNNKIKWKSALDWTWWRLMDIITSDKDIAAKWAETYWLDYDSFRFMAKQWYTDSLDEMLKQAYNKLDGNWKIAMNNLSKDVAIKTLQQLKNIDWQSTVGKNLQRILNSKQTNWLDIWKYVLWIPWKIEYWGFQSSIVLKNWAEKQTRYLIDEYDESLDKVDWQFRKKIQDWFTEQDIKQISDRTDFKNVIEDWKVNPKFFVEDNWKYILTTEWANALKLKVSQYTDAMRKADVYRAQAEWVEKMLNDALWKLVEGRWIDKNTVKRLAESWAFSKVVETFEAFC